MSQPVALVHSNGTVATACALHVTPGDMQVSCDRYTLDSLYPGGLARSPGSAPPVYAHFTLPMAMGMARLDVECTPLYVADLGREGFALGLAFRRFDNDGASLLDMFIGEAMALSRDFAAEMA